jgi:hypothetical protein
MTFTDLEVGDRPDFKHGMERDLRHPEKPPEHTITEYMFEREYTLPFTKENVEELNSKANPSAVCLSILRVDSNGQGVGHPYQITKYEDFVGRPFDDLFMHFLIAVTNPWKKKKRMEFGRVRRYRFR